MTSPRRTIKTVERLRPVAASTARMESPAMRRAIAADLSAAIATLPRLPADRKSVV